MVLAEHGFRLYDFVLHVIKFIPLKLGGEVAMRYQEQLEELVSIYIRSQKGDSDESFDALLKELRQLSNNWHNLKKSKELSFPEYTQLIEKKYHLSESIQLRRCN